MFIDDPVQRPGCERPEWRPRLAASFKLCCSRPIGHAIQNSQAFPDSEIATWQYIQSAQSEHQKHLSRPDSNPAYRGEILDDPLIGFRWQASERQLSGSQAPRKVSDRRFLR